MSDTDQSSSLGIGALEFEDKNPIHATRIGNIISLAPSKLLPVDFPPDLVSEEHELHLLEKGLEELKSDTQVQANDMGPNDEDWLDDTGNLIDQQLLIDSLLALKENTPYSPQRAQFVALQSIILSHQLMLWESAKKKIAKRRISAESRQNKKMCHRHLLKPIQSKRTSQKSTSTRQSLTYAQCSEVIDWYCANGESQSKAYQHFSQIYPNMGISQPNISRWIKNKDKIQDTAGSVSTQTKRVTKVKYPKSEELLVGWIRVCEKNGQFLSGDQIKEKWNHFA